MTKTSPWPAIATVFCLVAGFQLDAMSTPDNGFKYQEGANTYFLFAVFGAGATYVEFKKHS